MLKPRRRGVELTWVVAFIAIVLATLWLAVAGAIAWRWSSWRTPGDPSPALTAAQAELARPAGP